MAFQLVFITKYRYWVLDRDAVDRLRLLFRKDCTDFESTGDGWPRHSCPPSGPLSTEGGHLEAGQLAQGCLQSHAPARATWQGALWSPSYFAASCEGALYPRPEYGALRPHRVIPSKCWRPFGTEPLPS